MITNPTNRDILQAQHKKFNDMEVALTFNGNMLEELQKNIKLLVEENKLIKKQ